MAESGARRLQWSVYTVDPEAGPGDPPQVLVISRESANDALPVVTVVPLADLASGRRIYPNETCLPPAETGLESPAILMAHQISTIAKDRLAQRVGVVEDPQLRSAARTAVRVQLDLDDTQPEWVL